MRVACFLLLGFGVLLVASGAASLWTVLDERRGLGIQGKIGQTAAEVAVVESVGWSVSGLSDPVIGPSKRNGFWHYTGRMRGVVHPLVDNLLLGVGYGPQYASTLRIRQFYAVWYDDRRSQGFLVIVPHWCPAAAGAVLIATAVWVIRRARRAQRGMTNRFEIVASDSGLASGSSVPFERFTKEAATAKDAPSSRT